MRLDLQYADGRLERTSVAPERLDATVRELDVVLDPDELDALADRCR